MSTLRCCVQAVFLALGSLLPAQEKPTTSDAPFEASMKKSLATPTIGVVDLVRAFDQYPRAIKMKEELTKLQTSYQDQLKQQTKRLDELSENIRLLTEGSEERQVKQYQFEQGMQDRKFWAGRLEEKLRIEEMRMELVIYADLEVAIAKVAKNRGAQIVLRMHNGSPGRFEIDKVPPRELQARAMLFERRQVWFAADEVDLTADLIRLLQTFESEVPPVSPPAAVLPAPVVKPDAGKAPAKPERGGE